jgi:glycosyltransferase involved in cell wall biosynthesis
MPLNSSIILIDPRGNFNFQDQSVVNRHISYIKAFNLEHGRNTSLTVLGTQNYPLTESVQGVKIGRKTRNPLVYAFMCRRILSQNRVPFILVSADPWFTFLSSLVISQIFHKNSKLQLQLHGQYLTKSTSRIRIWIMRTYISNCIKLADQTRFVSQAEFEYFQKLRKLRESDLVLIPVPLSQEFLEDIPSGSLRPRPLSIGFVGRFHKERGLGNFLIIASKLRQLNPGLKIVAIGDGAEKKKFCSQLKSIFGQDMKVHPFLAPKDLKHHMAEIGVLLSTAPKEGYGLAMREAILRGIPVLATFSGGAHNLLVTVKSDCIQLCSEGDSAEELNSKFHQLLKSEYSPSELASRLGLGFQSTHDLVAAWRRLLLLVK